MHFLAFLPLEAKTLLAWARPLKKAVQEALGKIGGQLFNHVLCPRKFQN